MLSDNRIIILVTLWTAFFVVNSNIILILPLLPFLRLEFGLSAAESAVLLIAYPVLAFAANILLGPFIDKYGPRRFLLIGALGCALTFLLLAIAENTYLAMLWRAAAGFITPMMGASVFAAVADYYPQRDRPVIVGYVSSAPAVAPMVIMPLAILAGAEYSWRAPLFGLAAVCIVVAGGVWMIGKAQYSIREQ
jgi:MFS family permease